MVGIIQGRLSPPLHNKIQAFPIGTWDKEFYIAKECGFDGMELVIDSYKWEENPIWSDAGCERINEISQKSGIEIISVDPLYLTERGLISNNSEICEERLNFMEKIIPNCKKLDMKYILMPIVIHPDIEIITKLKSKENRPFLLDFLRQSLEIAEDFGLKLALETALNAQEIIDLIEDLNSSSIVVCYDTGNSAYFGHDILTDVEKLSEFLVEVHIKDHKNTDDDGVPINYYNSVEVGTGDVDFPSVFETLKKINFNGSYILQMARGDDHIKVAKSTLEFVKNYIN